MSGWNTGRRKRASEKESVGEKYDILTGAVTFCLGAGITTFLFLSNPYLHPFEAYNLVNDAVLLWLPLLAVLILLKQSPDEFGMSQGDRKFGLTAAFVAILCMIPILWFASTQATFKQYYGNTLSQPLAVGYYAFASWNKPPVNLLGLFYYESMMGLYFFCWEFFFRGFLLFGLARIKYVGSYGAVLLQTLPFTLLHWSLVPAASKPPMEIVSAFFGGLILGALALRTKSFFYGFVIHWVIALGLDLFFVAPYLMRHSP